ncbi:MAG: MBL fold metallo-hydrolase, partial [Pseudomonadota bacterium]|nr:MBL fold metallo-hydrolase [Pseudomonadota bacterium]
MEFTFLGTSAGTPTRSRNVTGLALSPADGRDWYLIDCGEGTQHQLLRTRYSVMQLKGIFITHIHGDHTFGLPGLLTSASMLGRTEPLDIIAPAQVQQLVHTVLANSDSNLSYPLNFIDSETPAFTWYDEHCKVTSVPLSHRVPCRAFVFTERNPERHLLQDKLRAEGIAPGPHWGDLQKGRDVTLADGRQVSSDDYTRAPRPPRRLIVAGDNDTPELLESPCRDCHAMIHEAT